MPEGPTIVILREEVARFAGKKILRASGNAKFDKSPFVGRRPDLSFMGKALPDRGAGIRRARALPDVRKLHHRLAQGSRIRDCGSRSATARSTSTAARSNRSSKPVDETYDWRGDVMSDQWDPAIARRKLRAVPDALVCDALLDQNVFAGVGNIIKNEVLFRIRVHPLSTVGALPPAKLRALVERGPAVRVRVPRVEEAVRACDSTGWRTTRAPARSAAESSHARTWARRTGAASSANAARCGTAATQAQDETQGEAEAPK